MTKMLLAICLLAAGIASPSWAQPAMVPSEQTPALCEGAVSDNCMGVRSYGNGNVYVGELKGGIRSGFGKLRILAKGRTRPGWIASDVPSTYIGEFKNDMLNGHGVWITDNGQRYEGEFVNNLMVAPQRQANPPCPAVPTFQSPSLQLQSQPAPAERRVPPSGPTMAGPAAENSSESGSAQLHVQPDE